MTLVKTKRGLTKGTEPAGPPQMFRDEPLWAVPSVWITIIGYREGSGWSELYQARDDHEAKRFLAFAMDADDAVHSRYDDFAIHPAQLTRKERPVERPSIRRPTATKVKSIRPRSARGRVRSTS